MDQFDEQILSFLQRHGRASLAELADQVPLTATPLARRLQRLESQGVIEGYTARLNQNALGFPVTVVLELSLGGKSQAIMEAFEARVRDIPEVIECYMTSGRSDYLLKVVAASLDSYHQFLRQSILSIPEVENVETSFVLHKVLDRQPLPLTRLTGL